MRRNPGTGFRQSTETLQPGMNDATCRTMAPALVYVITIDFSVHPWKHCLYQADGRSPMQSQNQHTSRFIGYSAGDKNALKIRRRRRKNLQSTQDPEQRDIVSLTCLCYCTRWHCLYCGFGAFALFNFGLTCTLPESMPDITKFLLTGLSFFAPYADKVSKINVRSPKESLKTNQRKHQRSAVRARTQRIKSPTE